ncbi:hypothetical protein EDD22DRAFT_854785 [Suillus occidentalis]|nr:hypothetical protein EDD22DRAFT_854785 [Suillus occidentalis]
MARLSGLEPRIPSLAAIFADLGPAFGDANFVRELRGSKAYWIPLSHGANSLSALMPAASAQQISRLVNKVSSGPCIGPVRDLLSTSGQGTFAEGDRSQFGRDGCARLEIRVLLTDAMNSLSTPPLPEEVIRPSSSRTCEKQVAECLPDADVTRDLDSVIGRLKKDNNVKSHVYDSQFMHPDSIMEPSAEIQVPMHKIPNMPLGKVQQRLCPNCAICCQHVLKGPADDEDDEDAPTVPVLYDNGAYFICDIVLNSNPILYL